MSGSVYGQGPYGVGRYSRKLTQTAIIHVQPPSRVQISARTPLANGTFRIQGHGRVQITGQRETLSRVAIAAVSSVMFSGERMWSALPVAPCQPWTMLTQCQCGAGLPNPIGAMFPSATT